MHSDVGSGMVLTRSDLFINFLLQENPFSNVYASEIELGSGLK